MQQGKSTGEHCAGQDLGDGVNGDICIDTGKGRLIWMEGKQHGISACEIPRRGRLCTIVIFSFDGFHTLSAAWRTTRPLSHFSICAHMVPHAPKTFVFTSMRQSGVLEQGGWPSPHGPLSQAIDQSALEGIEQGCKKCLTFPCTCMKRNGNPTSSPPSLSSHTRARIHHPCSISLLHYYYYYYYCYYYHY